MTIVRIPLPASTDEEGLCGLFSRSFKWRLVGETGPGLILQRIERTFKVHKMIDLLQAKIPIINRSLPGPVRNLDWWFRRYMSPAEIDNYVRPSGSTANATEAVYWEAWFIADGKDKPTYAGMKMGHKGVAKYDDQFQLCGIADSIANSQNSTRGKYTIFGAASYHPLPNESRPALEVCAAYGLVPVLSSCASGLPYSTQAPANLPASTSETAWTVTARWDASLQEPNGQGFGLSAVDSHEGCPTVYDRYW